MPAFVAPEGFQCQQGLVSLQGPELTAALETDLVLAAGGFNRPGTHRLLLAFALGVVHALAMRGEIAHFLGNVLPLGGCHRLGAVQQLLERLENSGCAVAGGFQLVKEGA